MGLPALTGCEGGEGMIRYVVRRILFLIPIIIAVSFIVFALMDLAPGSVINTVRVDMLTQEQMEEMIIAFNLDKPMIYRYGLYMVNLLQGDLGKSEQTQLDVWGLYISRLPNTLVLALASIVFGAAVGIPLGIIAARHAGTLIDNAVTFISLIGMSMPSFWLGLILIIQFTLTWKWLPTGGNSAGFRSVILPGICCGFMLMATCSRQTRSSMLEVLRADYLRTARAKGVPEKLVVRKHALGNAWIPILTTLGATLSQSIAGSAIIESVFAWPGVGRMVIEAVNNRDVTTAMGSVILTSVLYVLIQLVVDLMYSFVDPRIKSQFANTSGKRRVAT